MTVAPSSSVRLPNRIQRPIRTVAIAIHCDYHDRRVFVR